MNKTRLFGLGIIITASLLSYFIEKSEVSLFSGMLAGMGLSLVITGKLKMRSRSKHVPVDSE